MDQDDTLWWLGTAMIGLDTEEITLPEQLETADIVEPDSYVPMEIAGDPQEVYLIAGDSKFSPDDSPGVVMLKVSEERAVDLPAPLFFDVPVFEYGETVWFMASSDELKNGICQIVSEDVLQEQFNDELVERVTPG